MLASAHFLYKPRQTCSLSIFIEVRTFLSQVARLILVALFDPFHDHILQCRRHLPPRTSRTSSPWPNQPRCSKLASISMIKSTARVCKAKGLAAHTSRNTTRQHPYQAL